MFVMFEKNALITGGSGMIGTCIYFGNKPTSKELDITDNNSINNYILKLKNISCIIHLAAINLRESEENIDKAINVNINGTINMLNVAKTYNIPFILLSSCAVYSSQNSNIIFDENYIKSPNCKYGSTKSVAENIALLYEKSIVIRTGWVFGGIQKNHYKFVENTINNLYINSEIKGSIDFFGSPTYVIDLIEQIKYLIINSKFGVHHVVNSDFANGYEIAIEIAKVMNKDINLVIATKSSEIPNPGPLNRSKTEKLISINEYNKLRNWKISLNEYILSYLNKKLNITSKPLIVENNNWKNRNTCRLCDSYNLYIFYKMIPTPLANHFISEIKNQPIIPLDICICENCKHIQLLQIVNPECQYSNYLYLSSTSQTMIDHLENSVSNFISDLNLQNNDYILEIGANDGVCIKYLLKNGFTNVIGIDPAKNIKARHNLPIICDFFGKNLIKNDNINKYKLIYAFHCCAHIENIQEVFDTVHKLLDDNGTFIMEVGYFYQIFIKNYFDIVYHEHIDYHTCTAIQKFGEKHKLLLYNINENDIQGGSIQFYFSKNKNQIINKNVSMLIEKENSINLFDINNLNKWKTNVLLAGNDINIILNSFINMGKIIVGYGAPAKLTTFMYQYNLSNKTIKYIIDDNKLKQYMYTPGLHIPIKPFEILNTEKIDYIVIFSWNFSDEIIKKLTKYRNNGLRIIIPFPEIKII